ncbi:MAG: methylated-DNA--[protein]-cysteine S-methyltransferase [Bacteroidota bacterium]
MRITEADTISTYYEALVNRKEEYVGIFYVGVKTTSIFCIPTCRARKPKLENVEFFTTFKEAMDNGYRPCKICKPTQNAHQAPPQVEKALSMIKAQPKQKVSDQDLRNQDISPEVVRRWFNKNYGMTFQAYQRMYRINFAFQELKNGKKATDTAFDSGYESLSGFGYTYKKLVGKSPKKGKEPQVILMDRLTTPLGPMFMAATEKGLCLLEFVDRRMLETEFMELQKLLHARIMVGENAHIKQGKKELQEYFEGKREHFEVALDYPGTEFQQSVWQGLLDIPYGTTSSYQEQAEALKKPNAIRAMASANGCNRIAIIIPCHRVIGKDNKLRGYGGGLERKRWLLEHELRTAGNLDHPIWKKQGELFK